jgi:hypothetical protein
MRRIVVGTSCRIALETSIDPGAALGRQALYRLYSLEINRKRESIEFGPDIRFSFQLVSN